LGHRSDYYVTIPAIGIAISAAAGISLAWRSGWGWRMAAAGVAVLYLVPMIRMDRIAARWWRERDVPVRALVLGAAQARENHPRKAIVLDGVTNDLYNDAVAWQAFRAAGAENVYLTPASEDSLHPAFQPWLLDRFVMEPSVLRRAMLNDSAVIYSFAVDHLRNMTGAYRRRMLDRFPDTAPRRVEIGDPLYAFALGPEWGPIVSMQPSGFRWIPARATVHLGPPRNGRFLVLDGTCGPLKPLTGMSGCVNPEGRKAHLNVTLLGVKPAPPQAGDSRSVTSGGIAAPEMVGSEAVGPETSGNESNDRFHRLFHLPAAVPGDRELDVQIDLQSPQGTDSRLALETVAIQ
jgi:hypothetical protein